MGDAVVSLFPLIELTHLAGPVRSVGFRQHVVHRGNQARQCPRPLMCQDDVAMSRIYPGQLHEIADIEGQDAASSGCRLQQLLFKG